MAEPRRRNAERRRAQREFEADCAVSRAAFRGLAAAPDVGAAVEPALLTPADRAFAEIAANPRESWVRYIAPRFDESACYFTGTYRDEYGTSHGLMLCRNVHKDFRRFLYTLGLDDRQWVSAVERHQYRDILHLHALIEGSFTPEQRHFLKHLWERERGFARALPVLDGGASYVTKYALKGDSDWFDWELA